MFEDRAGAVRLRREGCKGSGRGCSDEPMLVLKCFSHGRHDARLILPDRTQSQNGPLAPLTATILQPGDQRGNGNRGSRPEFLQGDGGLQAYLLVAIAEQTG